MKSPKKRLSSMFWNCNVIYCRNNSVKKITVFHFKIEYIWILFRSSFYFYLFLWSFMLAYDVENLGRLSYSVEFINIIET